MRNWKVILISGVASLIMAFPFFIGTLASGEATPNDDVLPELPLPTITIPGPTVTLPVATVTVPGATVTVPDLPEGVIPRATVTVTQKPKPRATKTVTIIKRPVRTVTVTVSPTGQPVPSRGTVEPAPVVPGNPNDTPTKTETIVKRIFIGISLVLLMVVLLMALYLGYYLGYKDAQRDEDKFLRGIMEKMAIRRKPL